MSIAVIDYGSGNLTSAAKAVERAAREVGLDAAVGVTADPAVIARARPFLGICVGMQLLAREGHEHGTHPGLGWIDGIVEPLEPGDKGLKIPHMGWNDLILDQPGHPVLADVRTGDHVYFVHSYAFVPASPRDCLAHADYGGPVTAMVARDNMVGTQFHPEKSQRFGLALISNFLKWKP